MKRILLALGLLGLVGCTDIKVEGPKPKNGSRIKVIECNEHGSINGNIVHSLVVRDTKTEKEFLVFQTGQGITTVKLSD